MSKITQIVKANLKPLPVGEKWYEDRLAICAVCPLKSSNMEDSQLDFSRKIVRKTICLGEPLCDGCGCCTDRKCATKEATCGMIDLPDNDPRKVAPKWLALEAYSNLDKKLKAVNLTPELASMEVDKTKFVYNAGKVTETKVAFKFSLHRSGGFKVKDFSIPCGCTVAEQEVVDSNTTIFTINISTKGFTKNVETTKGLTINYTQGPSDNKVRMSPIYFKITKQ